MRLPCPRAAVLCRVDGCGALSLLLVLLGMCRNAAGCALLRGFGAGGDCLPAPCAGLPPPDGARPCVHCPAPGPALLGCRGCATNLLRTTPAAAVTFTSYEIISKAMRDMAKRRAGQRANQ